MMLEDALSDLVIAWRGMRRAPVFAAVVMLTLALGIGANTAVYSAVRRVLLTPLPFRDPAQLYRLYTRSADAGGDDDELSVVELRDLAALSRSISGLTFFGNYRGVTYVNDRTADPWQLVAVGPTFFDVLGLRPLLGRVFGGDDFARGAPHVVMITHHVWQHAFGGDRDIIGKVVQLSGRPYKVVGVLPERFVGPTFIADGLTPIDGGGALQQPRYARSRVWGAVARLRPGVTLQQWQAELATLQPRVAAAYPELRNAGVVLPKPLHEAIVGGAGPVLRLIMAAALVVLLATCTNIAGLFLSRAVARRRELGVRTALGAGRARLVRQVLTESIAYGIGGGVAGVLLATVLKVQLLRAAGQMLPSLGEVNMDAGVFAFGFVIAFASGLLFGAWPALVATRVDALVVLGDDATRGASRGAAAARSSRLLVSAQLALAVVLAVGAGLLMRTFATLVHTDLGYEATNQQATFFLSMGKFPDLPSRGAFVQSFIDRAHALPGVTAVGYTVTGPWNGDWRGVQLRIDGRSSQGDPPSAILATASREYFAAMGMHVRMGRGFDASDRVGSQPVIVISESMARRYWPGVSPIGARVRLTNFVVDPRDSTRTYQVVGVVNDVRKDAMTEAQPALYVSAEQSQIYGSTFVLRTRGDAAALLPELKELTHSLDAQVPLVSPRTFSDVLSDLVRRQALAMKLLGMFAALALILAGLGVYGMMAYDVVARTREFGIRSALGAPPAAIVDLVLREVLVTAGVGIAAGLGVAAVLSRLVASLLAGVSAHDTMTFVIAPLVLACVALVACILPVRAATRVDPVEALRLD